MSLDFGKLNFSISFNPTAAFPIDARCYFESLAAAEAAAASAQYAGNTDTVYYFGQNIVVVENDAANFYIIQPDGTLGEVGGKVTINSNLFEYDENNNLSLIGFSEAVAGAQLVKGADGSVSWVKPDSTTVEGLSTAIETLRQDVNSLTDNTYTKEEVDSHIAAAAHLRRKIVNSVDDITQYIAGSENEEHYIFMVPTGLQEDDDKYDEYIVVDGFIEKVGSWEVDLKDYAKKTDLEAKVDKDPNARLFTIVEAEKLEQIEAGAQKNYITSVEPAQFEVLEGKLKLIAIQQDIITGLADTLKNKVDVIEDKGLSSNDFTDELKSKLEAIKIADLNAALSKVNALDKDVYGYTDNDGQEVPGLIDIVPTLQTSIINLSTTTGNHEARISSLETSIENLNKVYVSQDNFNQVVGDLNTMLDEQINIMNEINDINKRLIWQDIE